MPDLDDDDYDKSYKKLVAESWERNAKQLKLREDDWDKIFAGIPQNWGRAMAEALAYGAWSLKPFAAIIRNPILAVAGLIYGVACIPVGVIVGAAGVVVGAGLKLGAAVTGNKTTNRLANSAFTFGVKSFLECQQRAFTEICLFAPVVAYCVANVPITLGMYLNLNIGGKILDMPKAVSIFGLNRLLGLPNGVAYAADKSILDAADKSDITRDIVTHYRIMGKLPHGPSSEVRPIDSIKDDEITVTAEPPASTVPTKPRRSIIRTRSSAGSTTDSTEPTTSTEPSASTEPPVKAAVGVVSTKPTRRS